MNARLLVLPSLCLGGAALLLAPAPETQAFSKIGGNLGTTQRDVRVFDNFADTTANNNVTPSSQFPGYLGVELAVWKGFVEWGSTLHGNGTGDPLSGNLLGNGGANFDPFWAGNTTGAGNANTNIVSASSSDPSCSGGTLAFTRTPISDGWQIIFCDSWTWDDGPGSISNRWDIQGVMTHEFGHALGLGHSTVGSATMAPSGSPGQTTIRSIEADDIAGIQCVYGVAAGTKPSIQATVADGVNITIYGSNFDATNNEVWFTSATATATTVDPRVRVLGVASGGTALTVAIPAAAGPGDVIVKIPGTANSTVSNAFPTDLVGTFGDVPGPHPNITSVSPPTIDALIPGTSQTVTLTGVDFLLTTDLLLDGVSIASSRYTVVNDTTIQVDMPQASGLGARTLSITDGVAADIIAITVQASATPQLELGTGDPLNVIDRNDGLDVLVSGPVGSLVAFRTSPQGFPNLDHFLNLAPANPNAQLFNGGGMVIPAKGWASFHVAPLPDPGPAGMDWFGLAFQVGGGRPYLASNQQSIHLVQ